MKSRAAMVFGRRHMISLLLLFLILGGISKPACADTTFYYKGPAFSIPECAAQFTPSSICISGNITASVTIPDSVVASGHANANQITSWSISAAGVTLSSSGGNYLEQDETGFSFSNGLPTIWELAAKTSNAPFPSGGGDFILTYWPGGGHGVEQFLAGSTNGTNTYSAVGIVYPTQPGTWTLTLGKTLGDCGCPAPNTVGQAGVAEPITVGTGNVFEKVTDYGTAGQNPLSFTRYYNSLGSTFYSDTFAKTLGVNWRGTFDSYLHITQATGQATSVVAERADGQALNFAFNGSSWTTDTDVDATLTQSGSTWTLKDRNDTVFIYTANSTGKGLLDSITLRNGYTQNLAYSGNQLQTVTDSYGRRLGFSYASNGMLETVTTPDSLVLTYGFTAATGGNQLTSVSYNTSPETSQTYVYENTDLPFALTGIIDENNNRFAAWTYDKLGRALTSQHGMDTSTADLTTLSYNSNGTTTVTNAFGVADTYTFSTLQNVPKVTQIGRAATSTTAEAREAFSYDSNGYMASQTNWNGNETRYVNNSHGLPTTIDEAVGTSVARTTTIAYNSTWVHLPETITTPGLTTSFTYDSKGELLTRELTDTTTTTFPYSTKGETRTWTNTWSDFLLASTKTPNGNTTKYGYDSSGALTSTTDAQGHVTKITSHTGGGLPETIIDPNGVTTTLTYSPRLWVTSSTVSGTGGKFETGWAYDATGDLIKTTLPDNSYLENAYDSAHRLIKVTDALGNYTSYTLDELGDRTETNVYENGGMLTRKRSDTFDALGRLLVDTAGAGQTTTRAYDSNGNALSVTDGLEHKTTNTYDALNRLDKSTDANGGVTTPSYDAHDRIISVKDANGNTTSYVRSGLEDVIEQLSPDSGKTVFHYDGDGNLTSKTDALGIIADQTFDPLDRVLTTTYPADSSMNVAYTYDQTGTGFGFGIGRLTSVKDAAGSLTRVYDERGNLSAEKRMNGKTTLTTGYTYDGAGRVATLAYPDGTLVTNVRNAAGYLSSESETPSGSKTSTPLASLVHLPFGPINSVTYGNKIAETWAFDADYRATGITDALSSKNLQNLAYVYDDANNVDNITDAVNAANTQTLEYDAINRLTSAVSGTGGYGSYSWTYDTVGNRLTQKSGSATTTYDYTTGTNRLASIGSVKVTTNANGNITSIPPANYSNSLAMFSFSVANRLASVTGTPLAATFVYDWAGQRFSKTNSGPPVVYSYMQDGTLIAENDNGTVTDYIYADGRPIAILKPGATPTANQVNYVTADRLGTPQVVSNSGGTPVWSTTYQPFGTTGIINGSINQYLRFPGQHADAETGFSYNLNRDYMPNLGRYLESDPIGLAGGLNTYRYARANPVRFKDRLGLDEENEQGDADADEFKLASESSYFLRFIAQRDPQFELAVSALEVAEQTTGAASVGSYIAAAACEPGSADAQAKRYAQILTGVISIPFPVIGIPLGVILPAALDFREQQAELQAARERNEELNRESGIDPEELFNDLSADIGAPLP
jgi:RHS repeat-associated protein